MTSSPRSSAFEDLGKLKDMIRSRLSSEFETMTGMKLKRDVLDKLDGLYSFELPEKLVEAEFNGIWSALTREMERAKKRSPMRKPPRKKPASEYRTIAERRVRLGLVLGTLGEKEGIQVTEQELQQSLLHRARQFPGQEKQVFDYYRKNPQALIELRGPVFEQKVVDILVSKAKVTDKTVTPRGLAGHGEGRGRRGRSRRSRPRLIMRVQAGLVALQGFDDEGLLPHLLAEGEVIGFVLGDTGALDPVEEFFAAKVEFLAVRG